MVFFVVIVGIMNLLISNSSNRKAYDEENYRQKYIEDTASMAVKISKKYKLFPSVMLAQSILESDWGRSELSKEYNNYFGIKEVKKEKA